MSKKWYISAMSRLRALSHFDTQTHAQDVGCLDNGDSRNCESSIEYHVCTVQLFAYPESGLEIQNIIVLDRD